MLELPDISAMVELFDLGVVLFERLIDILLIHALSIHFLTLLYTAWIKVPKFFDFLGVKNGVIFSCILGQRYP